MSKHSREERAYRYTQKDKVKATLLWPMDYAPALQAFDKECSARICEIENDPDKWGLMKAAFIRGFDSGSLYAIIASNKVAGICFVFGSIAGLFLGVLLSSLIYWSL